MAAIYINYPNPHITIHLNFNCGFVRIDDAARVRYLKTPLDGITLIRDIETKVLPFEAVAGRNGLWVVVDDVESAAIAQEIQNSLNKTYETTSQFPIGTHC